MTIDKDALRPVKSAGDEASGAPFSVHADAQPAEDDEFAPLLGVSAADDGFTSAEFERDSD